MRGGGNPDLGAVIHRLVPVKQLRKVNVCFPVPALWASHRSRPHRYFSHLIGHEGPGSALSLLKRRRLANALSAGCYVSASSFALFNVSVSSTLAPDHLFQAPHPESRSTRSPRILHRIPDQAPVHG